MLNFLLLHEPHAGLVSYGLFVRINPINFLAECRKRWLLCSCNWQAPLYCWDLCCCFYVFKNFPI